MNLISRVCRGMSSFCTIEQEISTVEKWSLQHADRCSPEERNEFGALVPKEVVE